MENCKIVDRNEKDKWLVNGIREIAKELKDEVLVHP